MAGLDPAIHALVARSRVRRVSHFMRNRPNGVLCTGVTADVGRAYKEG